MRRIVLPVFCFAVLVSMAISAVVLAANLDTRYVDATYGSDGGGANNCLTLASPCATIQHAIDVSNSGDHIHVAAGSYTEQVAIVGKNLTLQGAGAASTIIQAPSVLVNDPDGAKTIVLLSGAITAELSDFTIQGPVNGLNFGIYVRDGATANIHDNTVKDIRDDPLSGAQYGYGIEVGKYNNTPPFVNQVGHATITNNTVYGYQKTGIECEGAGSSATITGNTVTGAGLIPTTAQNGIQIRRGATGSITSNVVTGNAYTGHEVNATGIAVTYPGNDVVIQNNTVNHNTANIYTYQANGVQILGNQVTDAADGRIVAGITADSDDVATDSVGITVTISGNTVKNNLSGGSHMGPGIFLWGVRDGTVSANEIAGSGDDGLLIGASGNLTITNNVFTDNALLVADPNAAAIDLGGVIPELEIYGVQPNPLGGFAIHDNAFVGNPNGIWSYDSADVDASANWWGTTSGAAVAAATSGAVDFTPYLDAGTDANAAPGFQGSFATLDVTALGAQTGSTGRIQEGINLVTDSTVNVGAGTYNETNIQIAKSLTIVGDPGTPGVAGPGPNAPVIDGGSAVADAFDLANGVSNVTIEGFEIRNLAASDWTDGSGVGVQAWVPSTSNVTVSHNWFHDVGYAVLAGNDGSSAHYALGTHTGWSVTGNIAEHLYSIGFELTDTSNSSISNNVIHLGPVVDPYGYGPIGVFSQAHISESDLTVSGNTIDGTQYAFPAVYIYANPDVAPSPNLNGVFIRNNLLTSSSGTSQQVMVRDIPATGTGAPGTVTDVHVTNNSVLSLRNRTAVTVDATCNWWGQANGPFGAQVVGSATTVPWLVSSNLAGACAGITVASAALDASGNEGTTISTSGSFSDSNATISVNVGAPGTFVDHHNGTWSWSYLAPDQFGPTTITVTGHGQNGSTVTDAFDASAVNVAPTATFNAPASALYSSSFNLSLTSPHDVAADTLTYAFDCGSGYGATSGTSSASCTAPATAGPITVKGKIFDEDGGVTEYTASVAITQQAISLTPGSKDFGPVLVGTDSAPFTFTVKNAGTIDLTIGTVSLSGLNPDDFGIDANHCFATLVLAPNATCTIDVFFSPGSAGSKSATLVVASNDPNHPSVSSNLTGSGGVASNGIITITLDAHPNGSQNFSFNGSGGIGPFASVDDGTPANVNNFSKPAGDYTITVGSVSGWALIGLTCDAPETIKMAHRKVTIHLGAGENVSCTFTESKRQPDALIGTTSGGPLVGDGIYSSTVLPGQTQSQAIARSHTSSFFVTLQNDGLDTDSFKLLATISGSNKFKVRFFVGSTDITARLLAGTYSANGWAPGGQLVIEIRVTAKSSTGANATRNIDLSIRSKTASTARDIVRAHVTRA
jgi:parallel beta-helix repeat protein